MKELYREKDVVRNVSSVQFGFMDSASISQMAHMEIEVETMYLQTEKSGEPHPYGPLAKQLGTSQKDGTCQTCFKGINDCPGHFGYIQLCMPVYHYGYFKKILTILQCICKSCSRLLLPEEKISEYFHRAKCVKKSYLRKKPLLAEVTAACKKAKQCPHCNEMNGVTKKSGPCKIVHEKFRNTRKDDISKEIYKSKYASLFKSNPSLANEIPATVTENLMPADVQRLFSNMTKKDLAVLCMDPNTSHPTGLLLSCVAVPPNCIRPSVLSDQKAVGSNEDDITSLLASIVQANGAVRHCIANSTIETVYKLYDILQFYVNLLINVTAPPPSSIDPKLVPKKYRSGYVQRLKGKNGRFRGNLSGKRVDFSGRTVISPDPNLKIDQVGVPIEVAKILTYPEVVNEHNIDLMRQLIRNGPDVHPGAISFTDNRTGHKRMLRFQKKRKDRDQAAQSIREGFKIERHLMDGDTVLFNRQPSLHKMSIMAHSVKVLPNRTFRFNECVCGPYNADFDGDEMNLHLPQTEEARAEAKMLMNVTSNLVTPQSGSLIIGATQDFLTGSYLLTLKDSFFDRAGAIQLITVLIDGATKIDLPPPAIIKPLQLWTGKQLFSLIMKPNVMDPVKCNLSVSRCSVLKCPYKDEMCPHDGFVRIRNSQLLSGVMDKSLLGAGSKKNVFYTILKDYGKDFAAEAMWRTARISIQFLIMFGFSIGIGDLSPSTALLIEKQKVLKSGHATCLEYIKKLKNNELECSSGCSAEETLEQKMLSELSKIREEAGKCCLNELHHSNAALVMSRCGSKGSVINISQMIACVGQQAISGKRVPNGFTNRSLPYFKHHAKVPQAKGFVSNSFFSGLTPSEFLFHTMGGREGLVDTAVKTAETGYMQRRLVKNLEDLYISYDCTVRNSTQDVVQFKYGDDGLDPTHIETVSTKDDIKPPLEFGRILEHIKASIASDDNTLNSDDVCNLTENYFKNIDEIRQHSEISNAFKASIISFMKVEAEEMRKAEKIEERLKLKTKLRPLSFNQLVSFLDSLLNRYVGSSIFAKDGSRTEAGPGIIIEPGTAVGALCAQSIGEPATQMTLKTFHFAGVAAMNITLGVPRIMEIINATKNISTPVIEAQLLYNRHPIEARRVKARIEKTLLGEITEFIEMVANSEESYFTIKLSEYHINILQLKLDAENVKFSICNQSKINARDADVTVVNPRILKIRPNPTKDNPWHQMQFIIRELPKVRVMGLQTVNRVVIHQRAARDEEEDEKGVDAPVYQLFVEGNNLRDVIATYGVKGNKCKSNNIMEVREVLGIEAARSVIIKEITDTMKGHGLRVDCRHINLLADHMTCKGMVHGITRHGLAKVKESILTLASFEKTDDHLFEAAYHNQENEISGVSDCIIMGKPMNLGTGLFKLMQQHKRADDIPQQYKLNSEQLSFLEERERESESLRSVPKSSVRSGILRPRPLLFDAPDLHLPLFR